MAVTIAKFFERLKASGVLAPSEVESLLKKIPPEKRGQNAEKVVPKLIEAKRLTQHQAEAILAGQQATLVLGDYVILSKIGAGGMGQVYKARHRRMNRLVALKVLPASVTAQRESVKRFEREVEAAARLSHPNIVQAHDAGEQKGIHYLVMEYVDGSDLANIIKRQGPLSCGQAVQYMVQAARGLAHAHALGIVHRDIKPANLLVDGRGVVKILDMGLARFERREGEASEGLTQSGTLMGTIDYMSPEQALDTKNADARADIYSLGCTLYFLLTGQRMYEGDSLMKRLMAHRNEPIPSLAAARSDLPPGLAQAFAKMVAKSPQDRFQTMDEVSSALLALAGTPAAAASLAATGDLTVVGSPGGTTLLTGLTAEPPAPPPLAANTIGHGGGHTQQGAAPELLPASEAVPLFSQVFEFEGPASRAYGQRSRRAVESPPWSWIAALDRHAGELVGWGTPAHLALRGGAGLAALAAPVLLALVVWVVFFSSPSAEPGEKSGQGVAEGIDPAAIDPKAVADSGDSSSSAKGPGSPGATPPDGLSGSEPSPGGSEPTVPASAGALNLRPLGHARVRQGEVEIVKITIERTDCAGPVAVSLGGLPEKVTCAPQTIYASQDSVELRFAAAADAPLGESYVAVMAALGELTASRMFRLSVEPAASVRLLPLAARVLREGETISLPIKIERNGFSGPVQVSVAGLPPEVAVRNGGETILPGNDTCTLVLMAMGSAPLAAHDLRVSVAGGGFSDSQPLRLTLASRPSAAGGTGGGALVGGGTGGGTSAIPSTNVLFDFDPKKKELSEFAFENVRTAYEGTNYVLELGRGKRTNAAVVLCKAAVDFDCEVRCRLTGNAPGIRQTLVFRDEAPPPEEASHLTWWLNRYDQSCLVRQTWRLPKPGQPVEPSRETRISPYEAVPNLRHDGWNKLRLRARGPLVETFVNDKVFRRYTVGNAGYRPVSHSVIFWLVKDKDEDEGKLEFSEIKVTRLDSR